MTSVVVGLVFIILGMVWYPLGYFIIDSIHSQPVLWIEWILIYKNQECWLLIISGVFLWGWSVRTDAASSSS